jgi:phosphoglycerate dehydrogenase-like enzyme
VRVLFCGHGFPDAFQLLKERLPGDEVLACPEGSVREAARGVDVVIPAMCRISAEVIAGGNMRLIQQWGAGLEGVDIAAARKHGVWVANVPTGGTFNAESVAELAVLQILALIRQLPVAQANVTAGLLGTPMGKLLSQCTVCLFGLGNIGRALAQRLGGFCARLIGVSRDPVAAINAVPGLAACFAPGERLRALSQSDVAVLCLPLTPETRGCMGAAEFTAMPKGACVVNVGRGPLIDYVALVAALQRGHCGGAALDVFWQEPIDPRDPLLTFPNVIATPHIGGITRQSYDAIATALIANIERVRRGEPPLNRVA